MIRLSRIPIEKSLRWMDDHAFWKYWIQLERNSSVSLVQHKTGTIEHPPQTNKVIDSRNERTPSHPSSQAQRSTTATHKAIRFRELYMKQGEGFLLVFSITSMSSLNELQELREQIIRIKDDEKVPIVIVGNKSDLEEDRAVSRSRAFALSQQWGNAPYYETSARRRANVDEAFIDLCRQIIRKDIRSNKDRDREYGGSRKKEAGGGADKRRNRRRTKMKTDCVIL
ncbi:Ras-related protein rsr1 [Microsporum audouinii]